MTETKHRRPARRTLAHGQPLRRPMARRTPQRRPTAGQRPRPAVGRLWQLVVCGALLLGVVAIKLTAPDTLEPYRQRLLTLMGGDTDFTAAFSAVGHAFDGSLTGALDDAYTAVFGPRQAQPTAATYTAENTPEDVCLTQQVLGFAYAAPVQGTVTDGFGWRENAFHYGTDIAADAGTVISSFADGTVTAVGDSSQLGNYVTVSHAGAFTTLYAHCSRIIASSGASVKEGDVIAEVGETGVATGPHLHFELHEGSQYLNPIYYRAGTPAGAAAAGGPGAGAAGQRLWGGADDFRRPPVLSGGDRGGAGGASSESAVRAGSGGRPRLGGGGSPSVTVPLQPAAGAAPGRRPGAVSRGRMAGGSLRRGAHRLLGGGHDGAGSGRPGTVADRADRREPVAAAGCIRPAGGGSSGTARQKGGFFVKNTCIFLLAVVSYYGYKGWSSAVHTPECVDVPLREAA